MFPKLAALHGKLDLFRSLIDEMISERKEELKKKKSNRYDLLTVMLEAQEEDHNNQRGDGNRQVEVEAPVPICSRNGAADDGTQRCPHRSSGYDDAHVLGALSQRYQIAHD